MPRLPKRFDSCNCGADRGNIDVSQDGISTQYDCGDCGEMIADDVLGAEP